MGFGGLTVALASIFPDKLVMGMEIRAKVMRFESN
jgi:tRNA G46 methylase TrmB